jgi:uncharacterized protein YodC (DUF2158 family)
MISLLQPITPRFLDNVRESRQIGQLAMQNHLSTCGTQFRGCDPNCPKEIREQQEMAQQKPVEAAMVGEKVMLKSGGPVMLVDSLTDDGLLVCYWYDGQKMTSGQFDSRCLYHLVEFRAYSS